MIWILIIIASLIIFIISTAITMILDVLGFFTFPWFAAIGLMLMISAIWSAVEVLRQW